MKRLFITGLVIIIVLLSGCTADETPVQEKAQNEEPGVTQSLTGGETNTITVSEAGTDTMTVSQAEANIMKVSQAATHTMTAEP